MKQIVQPFLLCLILILAPGCITPQKPSIQLFEEFGGRQGVEELAERFIYRLAEDPVVIDAFADTDMDEFYRHITDQICMLVGGGCVYSGRNMAEAHEGMGVDPKQFNALVEDLMQAMDDLNIRQGAQNQLLKSMAPMYGDIVEN